MAENRAEDILRVLRKTHRMPKWIASTKDPFETLIVTVISQNTADRNTARAFENLSNKFKIEPEVLANAPTGKIEKCLKVAGLYRNKAIKIRQISKIIIDHYNGKLDSILSLPFEEARKTLLQLPGVGPKTADVVLLFSAEKPTIPVDTHVNRVTKRLGLAHVKDDYEAVRASLQAVLNPKDYLAAHVLLIMHGRRYCRARNPMCKECPLNTLCPSKHLCDKSD